jgi:hypothetical protein
MCRKFSRPPQALSLFSRGTLLGLNGGLEKNSDFQARQRFESNKKG